MNYIFILLQENAPGQEQIWIQFLFFGGIIAIFYFFMIRPQTKRQKEAKVFQESLSKGDKVKTYSGMHGKIVKVEEFTALLQIDENVKVRIDKNALQPVTEPAVEKKS
ncbi:MAG: preprotein translocase subunit YajC [Bacteroidota bacterium]